LDPLLLLWLLMSLLDPLLLLRLSVLLLLRLLCTCLRPLLLLLLVLLLCRWLRAALLPTLLLSRLALFFVLLFVLRVCRDNRREKQEQGSRTRNSNELHSKHPPLRSLLCRHADGQSA
jgi:hypothetical protein